MNTIKKTLISLALGSALFLQSCKDDEPSLLSRTIVTETGLTIEMSWSVGDEPEGYTLMDLDLLIDDITQGGDYEYSSGNPFGTEDVSELNSDSPDGEYFLGVYLYEFEPDGALTEGTANYTIRVYEQGNEASAVSFTGQIDETAITSLNSFAKYKITKNGTQYTITELSEVQAINNGYGRD